MKFLLLNEYGVVVDFTYDGLVACFWYAYGLNVEVLNLRGVN